MASHDLFPDWIELRYTSASRQKRALWPVIISGVPTAGLEPDLTVRVGAAQAATACVAAMISVIAPFFHTDATFDSYYVFHKPTISAPPVFIYTAPLGLPGTSANPTIPFSETVISFKTPQPGGLKIYLMEGTQPVDVKIGLPDPADATITNFLDFMLGDNAFIFGRNNNLPLAGINLTTKQNDFYRKKYKL